MMRSQSNAERQLTKENIEAVRNSKRAGASVALIRKLTGFSEAAIWKYTHNIEVDPQIARVQFPEAAGTYPTSTPSAIQPASPQGQNQPTLPRVESEVTAPSPALLPTGAQRSSQPLIIPPGTLNLSDQNWDTIKLLLAGSALRAGYIDVFAYFREKVVKDLDLAELMKNYLPGDYEELKQRFEQCMHWARTYLEMKREAEEKVRHDSNERNGNPRRG